MKHSSDQADAPGIPPFPPVASLFNLAAPDLIVIFFIVLLLFGTGKFSNLKGGFGAALREFRKAQQQFEAEYEPADQRREREVWPSYEMLAFLLVGMLIWFLACLLTER